MIATLSFGAFTSASAFVVTSSAPSAVVTVPTTVRPSFSVRCSGCVASSEVTASHFTVTSPANSVLIKAFPLCRPFSRSFPSSGRRFLASPGPPTLPLRKDIKTPRQFPCVSFSLLAIVRLSDPGGGAGEKSELRAAEMLLQSTERHFIRPRFPQTLQTSPFSAPPVYSFRFVSGDATHIFSRGNSAHATPHRSFCLCARRFRSALRVLRKVSRPAGFLRQRVASHHRLHYRFRHGQRRRCHLQSRHAQHRTRRTHHGHHASSHAVPNRRGGALPCCRFPLLSRRHRFSSRDRSRRRHSTQSGHRQNEKGAVFRFAGQRAHHPRARSRWTRLRARNHESNLDAHSRGLFHVSRPRHFFSRRSPPRRGMGLHHRRPASYGFGSAESETSPHRGKRNLRRRYRPRRSLRLADYRYSRRRFSRTRLQRR